MYRHSTPSVLPYLIEVHFTSTSPPRVHAYCPAPAGFAASAMPSRDADITESNNVRNQHGLSGRLLLQNTDLHIPVLHLQRASPEISNSAMPCTCLPTTHTLLGRAEGEVESDATNTGGRSFS